MLIKQNHVGWVGIKLNDWCANKEINFKITSNEMDRQLVKLEDSQFSKKTIDIAETLKKGIELQADFPQKQNMINYLESIIKQDHSSKISDIKMNRYRKG